MCHSRLVGAASAALFFVAATIVAQEQVATDNFGVGSPQVFVSKYRQYRDAQLKRTNPDLLIVPLGYIKGLSRSFQGVAGNVTIDLKTGSATTTLEGLRTNETYGVWLLERGAGTDDATLSDKSRSTKLIEASASSSTLRLNADIVKVLPSDFTFDRIVVYRGGASSKNILASGSLSVLQKIFFRRLSLTNDATGKLLFNETTAAPPLAHLIPDITLELSEANKEATTLTLTNRTMQSGAVAVTADDSNNQAAVDNLISQGAKLFFEKTFDGNGRTCGTCHPKEHNFQLDTAFIATLPPSDPLFVAEFTPALAQLERPALMRAFGLILENLDGLDDPTNKFVMRGIPHTLGMPVSLQQDTALPGAPAQMTGWSGDGAPGTGSLRDFATGAVTQHFTKTLNRVPGTDFKLPNEHQLDVMEAFQLSLGRENDFNLASVIFADASVESGKLLFLNGTGDPNAGGRCAGCHGNAGALAANGQNRNFNTNVEDVTHPAQAIQPFPHDGGFGQTANSAGTFGNRTFNVASVVEAADTAPFFHNNVVDTLAGVIAFYTGPEFNTPRAPTARFSFTSQQSTDLVRFMQAVNTLQNIDVAARELNEILALSGNPQKEIETRLATALEDTNDGISVLQQGGIYPSAVTALTAASQAIVQAQGTTNPSQRTTLIQQAVTQLATARSIVAS